MFEISPFLLSIFNFSCDKSENEQKEFQNAQNIYNHW